jgi:hypothetical protein
MTRPDQSDYLAHFTKGGDAYDKLISILLSKTIRAGSMPWTDNPAVCFTECPWPSLIGHAKRYSPYGVGFFKHHVFASGGGPAYYVRADHWKKQQWDEHVKTFVTPFWPDYRPTALRSQDYLSGKTIDFSHEREWRVPHNFTFGLDQVCFVIVKQYEDMAQFPRELKDEIGRQRFVIMDIYKNIERLWPVHNIE